MHWKTLTSGAVALAAALSSGCGTAPAAAVEPSGELLFANYCSPCHGDDGAGKAELEAPNLTGLPAWYVERQVHSFRARLRGGEFDDIAGLRMQPMAMTLSNDAEVEAVSTYIAGLASADVEVTLAGDAEKGKMFYGTCAACHGADGSGNEVLNAPPINNQADWYLLTQLEHFKSGLRGTNSKDVFGAQMRPMAMILPDEQAMLDVIAYIQTL